MLQVKREFEHRINKLINHPNLGQLVDSNEVDFIVLQVLEELSRYRNTYPVANSFYARNELIVSPLFEALFDCNIIWKSKYYDTFHIEHGL